VGCQSGKGGKPCRDYDYKREPFPGRGILS
jgi:hypothetical protein